MRCWSGARRFGTGRSSLPEPEALVGRTTPFWNVIVTRSFQLTPRESFLAESRIRPLFLTVAGHAPPSFPAEIEVYPGNDIPVPWILETLARRGIRNLLVEAGGDLLFQFLAADAIDELYVTLCPLLIGGAQTASLVDGPGFSLATMRRLRLQSKSSRSATSFICTTSYRARPSLPSKRTPPMLSNLPAARAQMAVSLAFTSSLPPSVWPCRS